MKLWAINQEKDGRKAESVLVLLLIRAQHVLRDILEQIKLT
jgi:hypothetical protein